MASPRSVPWFAALMRTVEHCTLGQNTFVAARLQREPTTVVLSRDTLFAGNYLQAYSDLNLAGTQVIVPQDVSVATDDPTELPRFLVVTNWFEELKERMGGN